MSKTAYLIAAVLIAIEAKAQTISDLGVLPTGNFSEARGVSADGTIVVGFSTLSYGARAFRWTSSGMQSLGTLSGGQHSEAVSITADGSVIVGYSTTSFGIRPFRWTSVGMVDLGTLPGGSRGGNDARAYGVSVDGSVVVGFSNSTNGYRAFRWTSTGMQDIGTLAGGNYSEARGVSADGTTIVGFSNTANGYRAFRWTQAGGMASLGTLGGGTNSYALGVSTDGNVAVGYSNNGASNRAFRWTQAGGMTDLGHLGGNSSIAYGVSSDGAVVVGESSNGAASKAFRWTSSDGMEDLGTLPGQSSSRAYGVSANGQYVVGMSGDRAFLYTHRVMLDSQDWLSSVGGVFSILSTSLDLTRAHLEGAHHRPLAELGRGKSYWLTGDVAGSSRSRDLITRSGEAGVTFEPWTNVLVGIGAGYGRQDQQLLNEGSATTFGQYLVGELDFLLNNGGILSVLVSSGDWQNESDRGYVTGSGVDYSHGETDILSSSFRVRYDTPSLVKTLGADINAYASYGQSRARANGYVETGGSYAGSFDEVEQIAKEGRLGLVASRAFGENFRARISAEWIRRFDTAQASITATDITSTLDLSLPGAPVVRNQARFGFDLDYLMDAKTTLSFTVHAAGRGESADVSGAVSLRRGF